TLYPQSISVALQGMEAVEEHYVEVTGDEALSDKVTVHVSVSDSEWDAGRVAEHLQSALHPTRHR
ncbi:MAG: hypothetical protein R6T89_06945, partial [Candidatus Syntrophosphaera sp.]